MMSTSSLQSLRARLKNIDTRAQRNKQDDSSHGNTGTLTSEVTDHTSWLHRIIESGSKPDDWLTYISYAEQRPHYSDQHSRYRYLFNMYNAALQHISLDENKKNITYAKLHIKFALLQGDEDVEDGRMQFQFARANLRTIALIHIAAAQYELDHGNLAKSRSILRKAKEVEAEPRDLLNKAMQKLLTGDKELYSLEQCGIKQDRVTGISLAAKMSEEGLSRRGSWLANNSGSGSSSSSSGSKESPCEELNTVSSLRSSAILPVNDEKDDTIPLQLPTTAQKNTAVREHFQHISQSASKSIRGSVFTPDAKPSLNLAATVGPSRASRGSSMFGGAIRLKRTSLPKVCENPGYDDDDNDDYDMLHGIKPLDNDNQITPGNDSLLRSELTPDHEAAGKGSGISFPSMVDHLHSKSRVSGNLVHVQGRQGTLSSISESPVCATSINTPEVPKLLSVMNSENRALLQSQKACADDVEMCDIADRSVERCALRQRQPIPFPQLHSDSKPVHECKNIEQVVPLQQLVFTPQYANPAAVHASNHVIMQPMQMTSTIKKDILVVNGRPYNVLRVIGKGGSSKVYQVFDEQKKKLYAIKDVNLEFADEVIVQGYLNEISLLGKLQNSDRIIHLYDHEITDVHMYMVMECGSIDLASFLRKESKNRAMKEEDIKSYWRQMLEAVDCIHKQGIIHSDLKPANFLFVDAKLKLIDFGIANAIQQDHTSVIRESQVGTLNYMSPEAIQDTSPTPHFDARGLRKPRLKINCKSDVWSLGCILYYIVYGKTPFQHITNHFAKLQAICDPMHQIQFPDTQHKMLIDILKKCMLRNAKDRPSIEELLCHPYLQSQPEKMMSQMQNMYMSRFEQQFKSILSQLTPHSPNSINCMTQSLMAQMNDSNDVAPVLPIAASQMVTSSTAPASQPQEMNGQALQGKPVTVKHFETQQKQSMEVGPSSFSFPQMSMPPPNVPTHPQRKPLGMVNQQKIAEDSSHQKTSLESKYLNSGAENGILLE